MPFGFACPECGLETLVEDEFAGHSGPCAGCGKTITVPFALKGQNAQLQQRYPSRQWRTIALIIGSSIVAALFVFSVVLWLLFPVLQTAGASLQRMECHSNLKAIAAALKQYEIIHGSLPPAFIADSTGKPMHSWRVLILPQLGHHGLYERYDFNQPWDGPQNVALISQMPDVFGCPADPDSRAKGETSYMAVVGPATAFPGATSTSTPAVRDDPTLTLLVVETRVVGIPWTQPKDLDATRMKFAVNAASGEISSMHPEGANIVTVDGTPHFVPELIPDEYLDGMSTISGGEIIPLESLE